MDYNTIATDAFAIVSASSALIKDGIFKGIGNDLWTLIKKPFKSNANDKKIVDEFEKNPDDPKLLGKAELRLAQLLEKDSDVAEELIKLIRTFKEKNEDNGAITISNSENVVIAKDIHLKDGNFIVGNSNQYGK